MARFIRSIIGYNDPVAVPWRVAVSQTIKSGNLVQIDATSRYLEAATATSTDLAGVAQQDITTAATVTPTDKISVLPLTDVIIRIPYVGTTKTSLEDTDLVTTLFALKAPVVGTETTLDLDTTTGGMCSVVDYDNTLKWADVIIADAAIKKIG